MKKHVSAAGFRRFINSRNATDVHRIRYCYHLGSTFVNLNLMEETFIEAMAMCDRIRLKNAIGEDASHWDQLSHKFQQLGSSTLGNLLGILERHDIAAADLNYLRWVKEKRDLFIHRFFRGGDWPGDIDVVRADQLCRTLLYLEFIFIRAGHRIWKIFHNAGLMVREDIGKSGAIMFNPDSLLDL